MIHKNHFFITTVIVLGKQVKGTKEKNEETLRLTFTLL